MRTTNIYSGSSKNLSRQGLPVQNRQPLKTTHKYRHQLVCSMVGIATLILSGLPSSAESLVERYSDIDLSGALAARGVIMPKAEVTFSSDLAAPISEMPLKAGDNFSKGDLLVGFDCGRSKAELRGVEASEKKQLLIVQNKTKLEQRHAASAFEVADAKAEHQIAKARTDMLKETMKFCNIEAPFDGRILELHTDSYEMPEANSPLITVVDDSVLELDLIVPSKWLRWVTIGTGFSFKVEETGESYQAKITRLGAKIDSVSQTIKITGMFYSRPKYVLPGMSGVAQFDPPTQ